MSTYTGSAFATKYAAYLIYKGSATAAALNISQPKIGYVYDITEGGTLTPGNITVQHGDAVVYLAQGWTHCNNGGADQAIADLSSQLDELIEEIGETDFSKFALKTELPTVPTKVSAFNNDAGYLTQHQSLANYALKTEIPDVSNFAPYSAIPQNVSQLTNDAHYLTEAVLNNRVRKVNDLAQDTDATDGEIVQLTTDGRFYRFTEPQAEGESGTWTTINQPADIASNDQILAQNNSGNLTATLGMSYNSTNQHLELKGIGDAVIAYVDMTAFLKDGMLDDVTYYTTAEPGITTPTPYIKFTFNTDSGKSVLRISLSDLLNIYDGANINLTSAFVKAAQYSAPARGDSMDVAIGKLLKGHEDNVAAISGKQDILTFDDAPQSGSNRPVTSQGIKAAIDSAIGGVPNALKQKDLTTYQGTDGEIVQHVGATTAEFVNGYVYKFKAGEIIIPANTLFIKAITGGRRYDSTDAEVAERIATYKLPFVHQGKKLIYESYANGMEVYFPNGEPKVGDPAVWGTGYVRHVTSVSAEKIIVDDYYEFPNSFAERDYYTDGNGVEIYTTFNAAYPFDGDFDSQQTYYELGTEWGAYQVTFTFSKSQSTTTFDEWQRINVQPTSEGAVSDLETRMTAAETAISGKQDSLTFDNAPTANSGNVVKSGGVKSAIDVAPRFYLGTCSTAGNVAIKQVDIPNFPTQLVNGVETPIVGSVIAVKFSNTDAAASEQKKIKVNNTSAYPIWYSTGEYTILVGNSIVCGTVNKYVYYVFDGTFWVWISHGLDWDSNTPPILGFGYASCDTAAATAAKTASLSNFQLKNGGLVVVYFQYDVPAQSTLNINNTGAKEIHFGSSRIAANVIKAGDKCLFIYNGNYMLIAIDRWGKELQEKVSGINISETDFESLSTYEQGKLYFVYDNNS